MTFDKILRVALSRSESTHLVTKEKIIVGLPGLLLAACLFILSQPTHAQETRRCQIKGKVVITNLSCDQLAREAGIPVVDQTKALGQALADKKMQEANTQPTLPQSAISPQNLAQIGSPVTQLLWSLIPLFIFFGAITLLVAWLKIRAKRAAIRHLSSVLPLAQEVLVEPILAKVMPPDEVLPYRQAPVMSKYELALFDRLKAALPECEIFPQMPLASFIQIDKKRAGSDYFSNSYRWQNRIGQQRVDFLACLRQDMSIISAIELDDPSHEAADAMLRDQKKNKSLKDANIPLIRWRVEAMPDVQEIRQTFVREGLLR